MLGCVRGKSLCSCSLSHHHSNELLIVDVSVTVDISLSDHFIDLLVSQFLAEISHNMPQLSRRNVSVAIFIEDTKKEDFVKVSGSAFE